MPAHEKEFAAKEANTNRTCGERGRCVFRHFDVGQQLNPLPIQGNRRGMTQAREAASFEFALTLLESVLGKDNWRRIYQHDAGIAIHNNPVILTHQLAGSTCANDSRNVHAARNDGGVGRLATHVSDKAREHASLELQHVGRRQVMRNQDQGHVGVVIQHAVELCLLVTLTALDTGNSRSCSRVIPYRDSGSTHALKYTLNDLLQIRFAFTQVFVLHLVKLARDGFKLRR